MNYQLQSYLDFIKFFFKPPSGELDVSKIGVNCFFNTPNVPIGEQAKDLQSIGIKNVRILCYWCDEIQPSENAPIDFNFLDDICGCLTRYNLKALMVIVGAPKWVKSLPQKNRVSKFQNFIAEVARHFKDKKCITTYQLGNEPNSTMFEDNVIYQFYNFDVYCNFFRECSTNIRYIDPLKKIVNAACTSIIQNYPNTIKYIKQSIESGNILSYVDSYAFHYYGDGFWNLLRKNGALSCLKDIDDFLSTVGRDLIITEIGCTRPNEHLEFLQEKLPYLSQRLSNNISTAYWYIYEGSLDGYGLTSGSLYTFLQNK